MMQLLLLVNSSSRSKKKGWDLTAGEVISQEPEAGNWEDPDTVNVVITVSTGDQDPASVQGTRILQMQQVHQTVQTQTTDTASTDNSAAVAAGEVWKCTQTLNTPAGSARWPGPSGTDSECKWNTDSICCFARSGNTVPI